MKTLPLLASAICLCCPLAQTKELPPAGDLASQTATAFLNHAKDARTLRASAKDQNDVTTSETLRHAAEVSSNLAISAITVLHVYCQINPGQRGPALDEMRLYLRYVAAAMDAQISSCDWVVSNAKRPGVISESERLRKDLRTFNDYLREIQKLRANDVLPPDGLKEPVF